MPQICIGVASTTALGKVIAFLWTLVIMVGPSYVALRSFLGRVSWIITDYGTERLIPDYKDILCSFLGMIGAPIPRTAKTFDFLFPRAVHSPGWGHVSDGLIRSLLCAFSWFPAWHKSCKGLVRFLWTHKDNLVIICKTAGMIGAAKVLAKAKIKKMAAWRWGTLQDCLQSVSEGVVETLQNVLGVISGYIHNMRDTAMGTDAMFALTSKAWLTQCRFVRWATAELTHLQRWGGSCMCHQGEFERGKNVECTAKGRLIPYAWDKANEVFDAMVDVANKWTADEWDNDRTFMLGLKAGVIALRKRGLPLPPPQK